MSEGLAPNPAWCRTTARLRLRPTGPGDLADLIRLKADPRVFAVMLGGVRTPAETARELALDIAAWGRFGVGLWSVRDRRDGGFLGLAGISPRPDGRGMGLRFALWPQAQGQGLAREAAGCALRYGHESAGLGRIVAVARADNYGSRMVLGGIGMRERERFEREGREMLLFESLAPGPIRWPRRADGRAGPSSPRAGAESSPRCG